MVHGVLPPNTKVKKTRLNSHKQKERIKAGTRTVNDRIAEAKAHKRRDKRKLPVARSGKAERSAADRPDGVAVGQTAPKPNRARPSLPRAAAAQGAAGTGTGAGGVLIGGVAIGAVVVVAAVAGGAVPRLQQPTKTRTFELQHR